MDKLDKDTRLIYISSWVEQKEEKRRKIKQEALIRIEQLKLLNEQVKKMGELVKERGVL